MTNTSMDKIIGFNTKNSEINEGEAQKGEPTKYDIPIEENIREEVSIMCNLSQGIREEATKEFIMNMYEEGYSLEQIAKVVRRSVDEVKSVIEKMKMALV